MKIDQNGFWAFIRPSLGLRKKYLISLAQDTQNFNLASLKCFHIKVGFSQICRGLMIHSASTIKKKSICTISTSKIDAICQIAPLDLFLSLDKKFA